MKNLRSPISLLSSVVLAIVVFFGVQLLVPTVSAFPGGAGSFSTSTPTANVCAACHSGSPSSGGSTSISGFATGNTYTPGTTIPLTVTVNDPNFSTYGFQLTSRLASSIATQGGTFTAGSGSNISSGSIQGSGSSKTFTFNWTPPSPAAGNVTFFLSGLATSSFGSNAPYTASVTLTPSAAATPDFSLAASPTAVSVAQGASGSSTMTVTPTNGFTGSVAFTASGLPSGVTASFTAKTLTLTASSTAAAGTSTVTITGTSGALSHTANVSLTVSATAPAPNFSLSASPTSLTIAPGASGFSTMTVTPTNGFTGSVAFSASGLPSGVTASFTAKTLTLTASSTAAAGTSTVTITGTSGALSHTANVSLTVSATAPAPNFSLAASPTSLTIAPGANGSSTMTVTPTNGFTGTVAFSASGLPSGVTASFTANTLTLTASSTAGAGTSTVTITGTSGALSHMAAVSLTVGATAPAPNFSLSASPSSVTVTQGASGSTTLTITPSGGFNLSSVSFSPPGLPAGLSAVFGPISSTGTSALTFSATSTAAPITVGLTITGTSGTLTHTTVVTLTVAASSSASGLTPTPTSLNFTSQGGARPPSQSLSVSTSKGPLSFTASSTGGTWLSASPTTGSAPGSIKVSVNPARMPSGTFSGMVILRASGAAETSVPVTLTVTAASCEDNCNGGSATIFAQPFVTDPNQSGLVTALWVNGLGMPSTGGRTNRIQGLVLSKNGGAPTGTLAGALVRNFTGSLSELGFDYRDGGQCTATSPRFVVVTSDSVTHIVGGCSKGTITAAPVAGWKRVRFNLADTAQAFPAITPGEQVSSLTLILDLGPESGAAAAGGLVVIDAVDINGTFAAPGFSFERDN